MQIPTHSIIQHSIQYHQQCCQCSTPPFDHILQQKQDRWLQVFIEAAVVYACELQSVSQAGVYLQNLAASYKWPQAVTAVISNVQFIWHVCRKRPLAAVAIFPMELLVIIRLCAASKERKSTG